MITTFDWKQFKPQQDLFKEKIILVTGAADGIGRAVTIELAKHGATVLMLDKKSRHLEKLYDAIYEQEHQEPVILPVDLAEVTPESATAIAQAIADDFTKLDGCLHNAAELGSPSPLDQYDMEYWNLVMQTNLHAPYYLSRALLPLLKQSTTSHLLFTTADVAKQAQAFWGAYAIAYAGLESQMTLWAEELEAITNIKVNSINPGAVRTSFRRRSHPGEDQQTLISPQQISLAYLKALSEENNFHGCHLQLQET